MKRIIVTGGSGKIGAWILKELLDRGHEVLNVDLKPAADPRCRTLIADLTDSGQAFGAIGVYTGIDELQPSLRAQPVDVLVHFAAIPRVQLVPDAEVFRINTTSTYNVMEAAVRAGIRKVVFASSEATYGVGAKWYFNRNWGIFAEWMKNDKIKVDSYLIGIDWKF